MDISMGHVPITDIGEKQHSFGLDVVCSGMAAGTKIPGRVYFDGNSDGPGQLNLDLGCAKDVYISLLSDKGVIIPFSLGNALAMIWMRSEPKGEIYRLSVVASYAKRNLQNTGVGKANAALIYLLEYN